MKKRAVTIRKKGQRRYTHVKRINTPMRQEHHTDEEWEAELEIRRKLCEAIKPFGLSKKYSNKVKMVINFGANEKKVLKIAEKFKKKQEEEALQDKEQKPQVRGIKKK